MAIKISKGNVDLKAGLVVNGISLLGRCFSLHLPVQLSYLVMSDSLRPPGLCSMPGLPVHHQLPEITQTQSIKSVMPSNHLILCHPLLLLPSIFPSIRVFSNESVLCIRWPKYWSFSFNITASNEYSGLISFRIDWLDLPAVQGTLKSLLQHHSSKASVRRCSTLFIVLTVTSIHDCWKNQSFDYTDLCRQNNVSAIEYTV